MCIFLISTTKSDMVFGINFILESAGVSYGFPPSMFVRHTGMNKFRIFMNVFSK